MAKNPTRLLSLTAAAGIAVIVGTLVAGRAAAEQQPNTAEALLHQCEAYVSGDAEALSRMTCENTIWSTLKAMDVSKTVDPKFKAPYCKPEGMDISMRQGADVFVKYVNEHPDVLRYPAEHAVILAIRSVYPCG
jgi:Rap1a immunity proteins